MTIPKALAKNDTIGIIAPASPLSQKDIQIFNDNITLLKNCGLNIILSKYLFSQDTYLAGSDRQRAIDLMNMFMNPQIKAILCARGGYGTERIIKYLDLKVIKNNPKIFAGFSNISILLNYFTNTFEFTTYHSPMLKDKLNSLSLDYLINFFYNPNFHYSISDLKSFNLSMLNCSSFEWLKTTPLAGGNLVTLASTLGTEYEINTKNKILLIEEIDEPVYKIDRAIIQLKNAGKLNTCSGFILGDFLNCNTSNINITYQKAILNILIPLKKPILLGLPFGHNENNITLPIGGTLL